MGFSPTDFLDLGSRNAVDKALSRRAAAASIRRVACGLYDVPRKHPIVGLAVPSADNVAKALAEKAGTRLQPTGAYAANLLGLSDQVPAKVVFLTDGRSKRVRIGKLRFSGVSRLLLTLVVIGRRNVPLGRSVSACGVSACSPDGDLLWEKTWARETRQRTEKIEDENLNRR